MEEGFKGGVELEGGDGGGEGGVRGCAGGENVQWCRREGGEEGCVASVWGSRGVCRCVGVLA